MSFPIPHTLKDQKVEATWPAGLAPVGNQQGSVRQPRRLSALLPSRLWRPAALLHHCQGILK